MEMYVWMVLGGLAVGFLAKTYWDVYLAYRQWAARAVRADELVAPPRAAGPAPLRRALGQLAGRADRALHAMLMSPTVR